MSPSAPEGAVRPVVVVAATRQELVARLAEAEPVAAEPSARSRRRAVVMTMGALHAGHGSLITAARSLVGPDGHVTVTVFVNPTQFAAGEDLDTYPRTLGPDVALCASLGADLVFAPTPEVIYPDGEPQVTVDPGELGKILEGAARPEHFRGVLTVVARLLGLTRPDVAVFGDKDYQQLALIRTMARDLELGTEIVGVPTVRDADGLALSSRNAYLSRVDRRRAQAIPQAIEAGVRAAETGADGPTVAAAAERALTASDEESDSPTVRPEYVVVTSPGLGPPPESGPARLLIAAIVGGVRLIDNAAIELGSDGGAVTEVGR